MKFHMTQVFMKWFKNFAAYFFTKQPNDLKKQFSVDRSIPKMYFFLFLIPKSYKSPNHTET